MSDKRNMDGWRCRNLVRMAIALFVAMSLCSAVAAESFELVGEGTFDFEFRVSEQCIYEFGIVVEAAPEEVKRVVGKPSSGVMLPGQYSIDVRGKSGSPVFYLEDFSGSSLGYRYGGERVKFIASQELMEVGRYSAKLRVLERGQGLEQIKLFFFVDKIPKVSC